MRIAFVSVEYSADPAYAVWTVLRDKMAQAREAGCDTVLVTVSNSVLTEEETGCEIRKVMPSFQLKDYVRGMALDKEHAELVPDIEKSIREAVSDCDAVVANDLVLQGWMAPYGLAVTRLGNVRHVIHSIPSNQFITRLGPGDRLAVLNGKLVAQAKEAYSTDAVDVLENAVDIADFMGFQDVTRKWIREWKLDTYDYVFTYPVCATRWAAKGVDWLALFTKYMNDQGLKAALVLLLSHVPEDQKFTFDRMHFSNAMYPEWRQGVPREVVRDFMLYSDGFMLPSRAETSSLIYMEAALAKNCVFLNRVLNLPALCPTANMLDSTNAMLESTLSRFLKESEHLAEFRKLRKEKNARVAGEKLKEWICRSST